MPGISTRGSFAGTWGFSNGKVLDPALKARASRRGGRLQPPAIVRVPGAYGDSKDKHFLSSSLGGIDTITAKSPRICIIYWKDMME